MARGNAAATREKLLDAGCALVHTQAFASLRIDDIVEQAGVAKGTFYLHFPDRTAFLVDLHRRFHDEIMAAVEQATVKKTHGNAKLLAGSLAYLDACLRKHPVKALLIGARAEPAIQTEIGHQNARFTRLASQSFSAAGWQASSHAARLWVGMVAEAALAEAEAGRAIPALRKALARFLEGARI
ncbi:MAG: TetR/AcrR family transcriptional regulator [Stenotrophobium sp.]